MYAVFVRGEKRKSENNKFGGICKKIFPTEYLAFTEASMWLYVKGISVYAGMYTFYINSAWQYIVKPVQRSLVIYFFSLWNGDRIIHKN